MSSAPDRLWPLVTWRASLTPDAEMLVDERGRRVTYLEFQARTLGAAAALAERGVGRESVVAWQLPTTIEALLVTAALARLEAVQVPLMPSYGARDVAHVLRQTGAEHIITVDHVDYGDAEVIEIGTGLPESRAALPAAAVMGDPVRWVFYTSGSTAAPKGARHTDGSVLASAHCMGDRLECTIDDRVGMAFPVAHIGGCGTWLGVALVHGTTLILDSAFDPERTTELLRRERVTLAGSGTVFTQIFLEQQRREPARRLLPDVRAYTTGAAPKPATLHADVKAELGGVGVLSGYGMTEAPILAMAGPRDPDTALTTAEGRLCEGVSARVVASDGRVCGPDEPGELRFKGPQVMTGYIDPDLDRDAFDSDGWLRSGDLGSVDGAGNLTVTGRLKDVIIRKGETISARAIEDDLLAHPAVAEVAVIGLPHEAYGETACAVVVRNGPETLTLTDLTALLEARGLPRRQWPERLVLRDDLPRSSTGKVLKSDLRAGILAG